MNMLVVGIFMRYCYPLVVVKSHLVGKQMDYPHESRNGQLFLILWCYTDFDAEELVSASCVVIADHFHFLVDSLRFPAAKVVEGKPIAKLALPKNILQRIAAVRYCLTLSYHLLSYLRPYISHHPHENEGRKTA